MIIRILGEGQWDVAEEHLGAMNALDATVEQAVEAGDHAAFAEGLAGLLEAVRSRGTRLDDDVFVQSDLVLPPGDATLEEVRGLLTEEGLVPDR